ncbi:hypothetical protein B0J13DRAFT_568382 [Dactylonectria estremocensis]|uniref:Uncharacterized protein n=1 Tax=Dactylonectria estremocensis TaxID=1079267 RepID=A0A9P9DJ62_9HYPO|nr:hypothetical protein B0J13DRAFT_568382 [Dactylonectria estremocensis]
MSTSHELGPSPASRPQQQTWESQFHAGSSGKSMEDPGAPALRFIDAMEGRMVQWMRDRESIRSPRMKYQAQATALEEKIRNEIARMPPNPSPQDYTAATQNTINLGGQLRDLQLKHAATIADDESSYVLKLYAHIKTFYKHMFSVMELRALEKLFEEYKKDMPKESEHPPHNLPVVGEPTQDESIQLQGNALPKESVQLDETTEPHETPQSQERGECLENTLQEDTTRPQETTQRDESTQLAIDHTSTHPDVQVPDTSEQEPDVNMQELDPQELDEVELLPTSASLSKRRRSAVAGPHEPSKRARTGQTRPSDSERAIDFNDVFQGGKAATKHIIVNYNDEWYILVCEEHDMIFTTNRPTRGAGVHLDSEAHGRMGRSEQQAIEHLGIRVRHCNALCANRNNEVTREAFKNGHQNPKKVRLFPRESSELSDDSDTFQPTKSTRNEEPSNSNSTSRRTRGEFVGVVDPIPGEIYLGYYNQWYAVLVLPSVAVEGAVYTGLPGRIQDKDMGFMDNLPRCFVLDLFTGALEWRKGYEDGGKSVTERQFPIVFFDVADFSNKNSIAWLPAKDLRAMDVHGPELKLVPNSKSVLKYLETRSNNQTDEPTAEIPEAMDPEDRPRDTSAVNRGNCEHVTNEANQPTQEQDGQSGSVPPEMVQNDLEEDDQGEHEEIDSSPLPSLVEMSPLESPPKSDWAVGAPQFTNDLLDTLPNDIPFNGKDAESLPEAREVSEGTSIGGLFRSFMNEDDFSYEPKLDQTNFQGYQAPSVVSMGSGSSSRSGSVPLEEVAPPPISAMPEMATVPSAPPAPVQGNQENGQPVLSDNAHLIQAVRDALQTGGLSSEDNFQSSTPGGRVYSAAATSAPGAPETREEPVNQLPIQRTPLEASPQAAREPVVVTQVTVQPPKTYEEFFANTAGGRQVDATTATPISRDQTSVHRKESISIDTTATWHQNIQVGPQPPPGFSPARRRRIFLPSPMELNASLVGPTTNQLPPLNPGPPNHAMPVSFSQPHLPSLPPVINYEAPQLRPDTGSMPIPQFPLPNMQAGPGQHLWPFQNQPLNGQQLKASVIVPILPSPTLSPQQSQHGQTRQDFLQSNRVRGTDAMFLCPHCPLRAHTQKWMDKHIISKHPNC